MKRDDGSGFSVHAGSACGKTAGRFVAVATLAAMALSLASCAGLISRVPGATEDAVSVSVSVSAQPTLTTEPVATATASAPEETATPEPTATEEITLPPQTEEPTPPPETPQPKTPAPKTPAPKPAPKPLAMPKNGTLFLHTKAKRLAPLNITVPKGRYYYILLKDKETQKAVLGVIVRPGNTVKIKVPLGTFNLYYATGLKWYGEKALFGEDTQYYQTSDDFEFTKTSGGYNGYTVELVEQEGGNLGFEEIDGDAFGS